MKLDDIEFVTPCNEDWNRMTGDDRVRLCRECNKNVYSLSEMTRVQAEAFITASEGRECIRLYKRPDGTIATSDCGTPKPGRVLMGKPAAR